MATETFSGRAVIFSRAEGSSAMMLRDFVRNNGGKFVEQTDSTAKALATLHRKEADLIVVDDDPEAPAAYALRQIIRDPIGIMTPTIAFAPSNDPKEETAMERLGRPKILTKPVTPDVFKPGFKATVALWNTPAYRTIRMAAAQLLDKNLESGLRSLVSLNNHQQLQPIIAPALAGFYCAAKNPRTAEKVLLVALKSFPRDLGIILALADLYIKVSMPETARKLLVSAKSSFGNSPAIIPDLIRCYVLLDQLSGAIIVAGELWAKQLLTKQLSAIFAKLLFAEGRIDEIGRYSKDRELINHLNDAWNAASKSEDVSAAS